VKSFAGRERRSVVFVPGGKQIPINLKMDPRGILTLDERTKACRTVISLLLLDAEVIKHEKKKKLTPQEELQERQQRNQLSAQRI